MNGSSNASRRDLEPRPSAGGLVDECDDLARGARFGTGQVPDGSERVVGLTEADEVLADVGDEGVGVRHVGVTHHRGGRVGERARNHPVADQRLCAGARPEEVPTPGRR
jgi:hypothetical protein